MAQQCGLSALPLSGMQSLGPLVSAEEGGEPMVESSRDERWHRLPDDFYDSEEEDGPIQKVGSGEVGSS